MRKDPEETYSLKEKLAVTAVLLLPVALAVVAKIGEKRHLREVEAMKNRPVRYYEYAIRPVDTVCSELWAMYFFIAAVVRLLPSSKASWG